MAITFDSIQDPYGLQQAGGVLGQALMQRGMMDRKQKAEIDKENRLIEKQKKYSSALGGALDQFKPKEGEPWGQVNPMQFMSQALSEGVPISDILTSMKAMQSGQPKSGATANTPFAKKMASANVDFLTNATDAGRKAREMLGTWDKLDASINDPNLSTNLLARGLKTTPLASAFYSPSDQAIATASKEIITNLTNMKGLRLTDAKLKWLEGIAPAPWKTPEANRESSAYFKRILQLQGAYGDIASNMADSYVQAGLDLPHNFEKLVDRAVEPLRNEIDDLYSASTKASSNAEKALEIGATVEKMPPAKGSEGMLIQDDRGQKFRSNGTKWVKEK